MASPGSRHVCGSPCQNEVQVGQEAYRWGPGTPNHEWLGRSTPDLAAIIDTSTGDNGATAVAKSPTGYWKTRGPPNHKSFIGGVEWERHQTGFRSPKDEDAQGGPIYPVPSG